MSPTSDIVKYPLLALVVPRLYTFEFHIFGQRALINNESICRLMLLVVTGVIVSVNYT